jgi:hypothetical protein
MKKLDLRDISCQVQEGTTEKVGTRRGRSHPGRDTQKWNKRQSQQEVASKLLRTGIKDVKSVECN